MSQTASIWRAKLAQQIAQRYHAPAGLLVGSVARNLADSASDIDILLYWEQLPSEAARQAHIEQIGGHSLTLGDSSEGEYDPALQSASDSFFLGDANLKIDITHKSLASVAKLIDDVSVQHDPHPVKLAVLNGMLYGIALTGAEKTASLLRQIPPLPLALRDVLLAHLLQESAWEITARLIQRGDELLARKRLLEQCEQMVRILVIVNRKYPPLTIKHLARTLNELQQLPQECEKRFMTVLQAPLQTGLKEAIKLYTDILDLVDAAGFNTRSARATIQFTTDNQDQAYELQEESNHHA